MPVPADSARRNGCISPERALRWGHFRNGSRLRSASSPPTHSVQNDLFDLVADLSNPVTGESDARIHEEHLQRLERAIDHFARDATDLSGMILPGGTLAAALLYQARGVVRRAERTVWAAIEAYPDQLNPLTARYLNRLSALLFVLARGANVEHGDVLWAPEASARAMAGESIESAEV